MTHGQIQASDIAGWDSLDAIASSFEKRGLKRQSGLGEDNELVLQLTDTEFIKLVKAEPGESPSDLKPSNRAQRTNLVATHDFEEFTFLTRVRSWEGQQHGRIRHQRLSFTREQMTSESGEKNTILQKLNSIEYGSSEAIEDTLYDTQQVVKEFYQQFEDLRTDLVQEVSGVPEGSGDDKQRYVQVLLNRMIFLYFIQEKRLLDRKTDYLRQHHDRVIEDEGGDIYEDFYEPLFFEYLAKDKNHEDFGSLPFLNGGLFSKSPVEQKHDEVRLGGSTARTNDLFEQILEFLDGWNWNVDERLDIADPKNLSPAILGHIFEQTVTQKEMGAYYTPEEITGFMARRTIHPYLLDQLNEAVGAEYDEIDEVFGLSGSDGGGDTQVVADGGVLTVQAVPENVQTSHIETLYHEILTEARILDPAVGSGAFLLAAQEVLLDIYIQCIEFFQQLDSKGRGWELKDKTREEVEQIEKSRGSPTLYAKRQIILNNLYGVDIDDGAVEICKLRLWLSMVADIEDEPSEVDPLPNIDFNIRQGNSLIGFTEVQEVANEEGDAALSNFGGGVGESVQQMYDDVITAVERHRAATSAEEAANARRLAESNIDQHSQTLDQKILEDVDDDSLGEVSIEDIQKHHPFHWVLEFATVYRDGGFDVVIGNPPWDVLTTNREEFFSKYKPAFRSFTPEKKDRIEQELLEDPEVEAAWKSYESDMEIRAEYFNSSSTYSLQSPKIDGRTVPNNQNDLSALFIERSFNISSDDGYVAQILPGSIFNGLNSKDIRSYLIDNTTVESIIGFENHGIFQHVDNRYNFAITIFQNSGNTSELNGIFQQKSVDILNDFENRAATISADVLRRFSIKAKTFPYITSQSHADVLEKLLEQPSIDEEIEGAWRIEPFTELHSSKDSQRFYSEPQDYPVYGGRNIYQFHHNNDLIDISPTELWSVEEDQPEKSAKYRIREKSLPKLKKALYEKFDGTGSQISFVNGLLEDARGEPLSEDDVMLTSEYYRIAFRDVTNSTNERTVIASVLPKGMVTHDKCPVIKPYVINPDRSDLTDFPIHDVYEPAFTEKELFVAVGLLNSIAFDFLMRSKVDTSVAFYKLAESQIPRLTEGDEYFNYIADRASRLNCYGEEFAEMRERLGGIEPATDDRKRRRLQAEIDAAAFHAYGLEQDEVDFILDDFHRVQNPRMMTDEYFEMVLEKFKTLEQEGPFK